MHTASQALAIERQASAQPSLAERVSRPKTRAILGLMRLNFLSVFKGVANLTQCPEKLLNRTYNVEAFDIKGNLKLTANTKEIVASKIRAMYDISTTLVRR
jgi:hypothetical protein